MTDATTNGGLRAILFAGVEESGEFVPPDGDDGELLMAKHELLLHQALAQHELLVHQVLAEHDGNAIETVGDSFMAWFRDTVTVSPKAPVERAAMPATKTIDILATVTICSIRVNPCCPMTRLQLRLRWLIRWLKGQVDAATVS